LIQSVIQIAIENGFQAIGWAVLKVLSFGRYQGYKPDDMLSEGALGFGTVLLVGYAIYRWI